MLAHDLIVWTQALLLDGALANAEPKRLRYQLLHLAGRLGVPQPQGEAPTHLAMGRGARRRLHEAQSAPSPSRLTATTRRLTPSSSPSGHGHDHCCPQTGKTAAATPHDHPATATITPQHTTLDRP